MALGEGDFSDAAGFVDWEASSNLGVLFNLGGFASAEIFLVDVGGLSGFADEGRSSDMVTFFVIGLLGTGGSGGGCLLSSGFFSIVTILGDEADLFGGVSLAD